MESNNAIALSEIQKEATEFGIEPSKVANLVGNLPSIQQERIPLAAQYEEVIRMDIDDPKTSEIAKKLRLRIRDNRTKGIAVWHKTTKDYFLKGGQFVDAIKRREEAVNIQMEDNLEQIENYLAIKKQKELEALRMKRKDEIQPYMEFVPPVDLGTLSDEDYTKVFRGAKLQYDHKLAEEQRLQEEQKRLMAIQELERKRIELLVAENLWSYFMRINNDRKVGELTEEDFNQTKAEAEAEKKAEEAEKDRIQKENERLMQEAMERELEMERQREEAKRQKEEQEAKERAIIAEQQRIKAENDAAIRKAAEEAQQREKLLQDQIRKEQEERERLERELAAKQEQERQKQIAEENRKKKLSDKEKLMEVASGIKKLMDTMPTAQTLKSEAGKQIILNVNDHLSKLINYIHTNAQN